MEGSALRGRKNPMKPAVSWHTKTVEYCMYFLFFILRG